MEGYVLAEGISPIKKENLMEWNTVYGEFLKTPNEAEVKKLKEELLEKEINHIVLVRGFLTDIAYNQGVMMADIEEFCRSTLGLPVTYVNKSHGFDAENDEVSNAEAIRQAINDINSKDKLLLITHSKGSVDTLVCLESNPTSRDKVGGWISIQGAIGGSPVADFAVAALNVANTAGRTRGIPVNLIVAGFFSLVLGGSRKSLDNLQQSIRGQYLKRNGTSIALWNKNFPVVAYGSGANAQNSLLRMVTAPIFAANGIIGNNLDLALTSITERSLDADLLGALVRSAQGGDDGRSLLDRFRQKVGNKVPNLVEKFQSRNLFEGVPDAFCDKIETIDPNDGLVSVKSSEIPGARLVQDTAGPDHAEAVMDMSRLGQNGFNGDPWDRQRMIYALFKVLIT